MFQYLLHLIFFIQYASCGPTTSIPQWLNDHLITNPATIAYIIHLQNDKTVYPEFKSKRSIVEGIHTDDNLYVVEIKKEIDAVRQKRTAENATSSATSKNGIDLLQGLKDLHLKGNLRYHHQQQHPNGTVSGSYALADSSGRLRIMHYINDEKGFREYPERIELDRSNYKQNEAVKSPSGNGDIISQGNSNSGSPNLNKQNHIVSASSAPYSVPGLAYGLPPTSILYPSAGSFAGQQIPTRSPLYYKYYRPTPEEAQKANELHHIQNSLDANALLPTDIAQMPDLSQVPFTNQAPDDTLPPYLGLNSLGDASFAPPLIPQVANVPLHQPQDLVPRQTPFSSQGTYPQTLEPQTPIYFQSYDGLPFVPASTYSGPYLPNTATFNHPYPTNIPIYNSPIPQNIPTYSHPPPNNIPVYSQPQPLGYGQNVYYASASGPSPAIVTKA